MNELIKTCISKTHNWVLQFKQENSPSIPTHPQTRLPKKKKPWLSLFGKNVLLWYLFLTDDYNVF